MSRAWILAMLAAAACGGTTGTVKVSLVTAAGSHVLDAVQKLRLTLSDPRQVVEATRTATGFDLNFELDASTAPGLLVVEGFDAGGALVACGQSPAFALDAIDASVAVYVAAPNSIATAPVKLATARSEIAATALTFGVALAGGRAASGAPTTNLEVYNAFNHSIAVGAPLPAARAGVAIASTNNQVLLFGGDGPDGKPTGTLLQFDTTVAPNGVYTTIADQAGFARSGQIMHAVTGVGFVITGDMPLVFNGATLAARADIASLPPAAGGLDAAAVFVGESIIRLASGAFTPLATAGRVAPGVTTRVDGHVIVVGGGAPLTRDALDIDPATGTVTPVASVLSTGRRHPAVAATGRHIVVAGGADDAGAAIASADILDATTLALITTVPIEPRTGTVAIALPTDQVMIAGGEPASADLELFTPPPPPGL
ncbi:MAG TPA: hypothetical protein VFP84_38940 [Kofleriaceae bacterium]|nr:hypothetical protein [Kofleriaceae bacterium]